MKRNETKRIDKGLTPRWQGTAPCATTARLVNDWNDERTAVVQNSKSIPPRVQDAPSCSATDPPCPSLSPPAPRCPSFSPSPYPSFVLVIVFARHKSRPVTAHGRPLSTEQGVGISEERVREGQSVSPCPVLLFEMWTVWTGNNLQTAQGGCISCSVLVLQEWAGRSSLSEASERSGVRASGVRVLR